MWSEVTLVLGKDDWLSLLTSKSVAEWGLNNDLLKNGAVLEGDSQSVSNGALLRIMVIRSELLILDTLNLLSQRLNKWRSSSLSTISVVRGLKTAIDKLDSSHVLKAVIAISKVVHRLELLIDNTDTSLMGTALDMLDILSRLPHINELLADSGRGLNGGLGVELGRVGHLEEHVLHDVAAIWALELERLALEENVVETPDWSGEDGWHTWLAGCDLEGEIDGALAGVAGGPGLAGHCVWGVAVGAEGLSVDPGLGDGVAGLDLGQAEELGDNSSGCDLDQNDVVEANLVVRVEKRQASLDLVGLNHGLEDLLDGDNLAVAQVPSSTVGAGNPVSDGQDSSEVVGWVTPLSGQPAVVVIEPSDHGTDVEGGVDWVELEVGSWNLWAVWNDGPWNDWAEELGALLEA